MNWNRRKALPDWEKRRIRNRHEKYLRKEKRSACVMALLVLAIIVVGIVGQIILVGGVIVTLTMLGFLAGEITAASILL